MKGFISYAHDDHQMFGKFRTHLAALERAFDIAFWADESIHAGYHWDAAIQQAIDAAELFVLLVSPAYRASTYISGREIPAIQARLRSVNGLVCPVILTRCDWEPLVGQLQAVPRQNRRLVPIAQWPRMEEGYDQARAEISAAIRGHFNLVPRTTHWAGSLTDLQQERPGPLWAERGDQYGLDPAGGGQDADVAPTVFISYSHDNDDHQTKVLNLANRLRREGVNASIDAYMQHPAEGWPKWMESQLRSDFLVVILSPRYTTEFNQDVRRSSGARYEGGIISSLLLSTGLRFEKMAIVCFDNWHDLDPSSTVGVLFRG